MIQKPANLLQIDKYESFLPRPSEKPEDFCDPINSSFLWKQICVEDQLEAQQ